MPKQQAGHAPMLQKPPCRQTAGWFSAARPVAVRCLFLARRYNTLDFAIPAIKRRSRSLATLGDCKQSLSLVRQAGPHAKSCANRDAARPYWKPRGKRNIPFAIPHFPRRCIYKLQKAACNACSENAKGSLHRCVAQTSFWTEMQKKGKHFLLHSRDPRGGDER